MGKENYLAARDEYINLIKQELLGPGSEVSIPDKEHELITNAPDVRYSIGILFPKNNKLNADNDDSARIEEPNKSEEDGNTEESAMDLPQTVTEQSEKPTLFSSEDENLDEEISLASQNMPSSLGVTFLTSSNPKTIHCEVDFATYRHLGADLREAVHDLHQVAQVLVHLFDGSLIDGLRAQVFDPSQQRGGGGAQLVGRLFGQSDPYTVLFVLFGRAESDETQQDEDRNDGELDVREPIEGF